MSRTINKQSSWEQGNNLQVKYERSKLSSLFFPTFHFAQFFSPVSFPSPDYTFFPQGVLYLNIYREPIIKALIKEQNEELYRLIKKVHFDGKYYRVKCVHAGKWEYCWDLAIKVQFFGVIQGFAFEPEKIVSKKNKKIIYKFLILVSPHELWGRELVEKLWNLQDRIEFLIAKILFHECIHILIFLGKTLPSGFEQTNIFLEFTKMLEFASSEKSCPESYDVQSCLRSLADLAANFSEKSEKNLDIVPELYEFLVNEKYSFKKTDVAFGLSWSNKKVSLNYARIISSKIGSCSEFNKTIWKKEVNRLYKNLEDLYERIDENQSSWIRRIEEFA